MDTSPLGKTLILTGIILVGAGLLLTVIHKVPYIGKLPGDIYVEKKNFTFYFPLATSILVSAVLTFLLWLFSRR